jgi:ABC-type multidrug transport system fused ATPase/permease subunit
MNSVERIQEWATLEQEAPAIIEDNRPKESWPAAGKIDISNLSISYNGNEMVLSNVSASIKPRERIGIVGRTGAGALIRPLAQPSGF